MGVMTLAAETGSTIKVVTDGSDETQAMQAIEELIENKFYEE